MTRKARDPWRNRIVGVGEEAPDQILANPFNARIHPKAQREALSDLIDEVGIVQRVIVNQRTQHLIDGHLRVELALSREEPVVYVEYVDLSLDEERKVLALFDPIGAMAVTDRAVVGELLRTVDTQSAAVQGVLDDLATKAGVVPGVDEQGPEKGQIIGHSDGYDFRDINPLKLAYRVEAAWRSMGGIGLDLYSGEGQLATLYARRFERVIRCDRVDRDGIAYGGSALSYVRGPFRDIAASVSFIDLDDEGSPGREIQALFAALPPERCAPFIMALTDGSGLNLKLHGKLDPALYALEGEQRRATTDDYHVLEELVTGCVERSATKAGWTAARLSSARGSEGNVVYQTFEVTRPT